MGPAGGKAEKAVVIGAGMGGLAAAIRLSALGFDVTVIDMAEGPGGKARALPSAAGPVDTGPTVLTMRAVLDELFILCGTRTDDCLDLVPLPELARHWWPDGSQLDLFTNVDANMAAITAFAGAREADAFRRFDRLASALFAAFDAPVMQAAKPRLSTIAATALRQPRLWPALVPGLSLTGLLRQFFRDPRLVQLFGRYATYVGGRPDHTPAVLSLVWRAEAAGVWAARQGMHGVALALSRAAESRGVRFRYATRARRIVRQSGRVSGVEIEGGATLPCAVCVFNGDPAALRTGHLGPAAQDALPGRAAKPSLSAWVWAFAAQPKGADLCHHNVFFTADPAAEFGPIAKGSMPTDPTLYICAQDRGLGPATATAHTERFEIIMNGPAGHAPPPQEEDQCRTRTFQRLKTFGLTFTPDPDSAALTTPATLARRYPGSQGAIYGQTPEGSLAAFQRPTARTTLPGLFLAGGGAHPGAGVPMAILSARHVAAAITQDRISASKSAPTATPGGMSTASRTTGRAPSR